MENTSLALANLINAMNLDQQNLLSKIQHLEEKINSLEDKLSKVNEYIEIEPYSLGTYSYQGETKTFLIPNNLIPINAKEILIMTFLRCGNEQPSRSFMTSIYTQDENRKNIRYVKAARYGQSAISFNSNQFWIPFCLNNNIFVYSSDAQLSNCHGMEIILLGYRI